MCTLALCWIFTLLPISAIEPSKTVWIIVFNFICLHLFHSCYALLYHTYPQIRHLPWLFSMRCVSVCVCVNIHFFPRLFIFFVKCKYLLSVFRFLHTVFTVMADATYYCYCFYSLLISSLIVWHIITSHNGIPPRKSLHA